MVIIWLAAFLVFLVLEMATAELVSVWFALGSLGGMVCALAAPQLIWLQIALFILIAAATLFFTRPLAKKHLNAKKQATNADRLIGSVGVVTEKIENLNAAGAVYIGGKTWSARSAAGESLEPGTLVKALRIEGVKLIVCKEERKEDV